MEDSKIRVFLKGDYREVDYDDFINTFTSKSFHYSDDVIQASFLYIPLKVTEEDKARIKKSFKNEVNKEEEWLKNNNTFSEVYKNRLYNFLYHLRFYNCKQEAKPGILKLLKVPQFFVQQVLKDFTMK